MHVKVTSRLVNALEGTSASILQYCEQHISALAGGRGGAWFGSYSNTKKLCPVSQHLLLAKVVVNLMSVPDDVHENRCRCHFLAVV